MHGQGTQVNDKHIFLSILAFSSTALTLVRPASKAPPTFNIHLFIHGAQPSYKAVLNTQVIDQPSLAHLEHTYGIINVFQLK